MCFNLSLAAFQKYIEERFGARFSHDGFKPIYHLKADQQRYLPIICQESPETIQPFQWRFIPPWAKNLQDAEKRRRGTYNATCERVFEAPTYRGSIFKKRCLILANGYFEWLLYSDGKKYPYFITRKDREAFAFGGIYNIWHDQENNKIYPTFAIITTPASPLLEEVHNVKKRMPLILPPEKEKEWLKKDLTKEQINGFFKPAKDTGWMAYPVEKSNILKGIDDKTVIEPFEYPGLPGFD